MLDYVYLKQCMSMLHEWNVDATRVDARRVDGIQVDCGREDNRQIK